MGAVLPFLGSGRLASTWVGDGEWFARRPGRAYRVRSLVNSEGHQARCHHGPTAGSLTYFVAVRMLQPGVFHRRFVIGDTCDGSEEACRGVFERGLIAGIASSIPPDDHHPLGAA